MKEDRVRHSLKQSVVMFNFVHGIRMIRSDERRRFLQNILSAESKRLKVAKSARRRFSSDQHGWRKAESSKKIYSDELLFHFDF